MLRDVSGILEQIPVRVLRDIDFDQMIPVRLLQVTLMPPREKLTLGRAGVILAREWRRWYCGRRQMDGGGGGRPAGAAMASAAAADPPND